jgi:hypothetical protein
MTTDSRAAIAAANIDCVIVGLQEQINSAERIVATFEVAENMLALTEKIMNANMLRSMLTSTQDAVDERNLDLLQTESGAAAMIDFLYRKNTVLYIC